MLPVEFCLLPYSSVKVDLYCGALFIMLSELNAIHQRLGATMFGYQIGYVAVSSDKKR